MPLVVPPSTRSVKLVRPELAQLEARAELESFAHETIATTSVFATVVVAPGIETDALEDPVFPAVISHGLPDAIAPRNVIILAIWWSPESATTGFAIDEDVARFQKTERRVADVPAAVPVPCGELVTAAKPAGVESVTAWLAVSTISRATSPD